MREQELLQKFLQLNCAGDVLNSMFPAKVPDVASCIIDAMRAVEKIKSDVLRNPGKVSVVEICSGHDFTGKLIAHLLPVKKVTSLHKRISEQKNFLNCERPVEKFEVKQLNIETQSEELIKELLTDKNTLIISTKPTAKVKNLLGLVKTALNNTVELVIL